MRTQAGFTLIDIVMVLVLLGILAAVAAPKYFDYQDAAEQRAALATVAEAQARLEATFSEKLLEGQSCVEAISYANNIEHLADNGKNMFGDYTITKFSDIGHLTVSKNKKVILSNAYFTYPSCDKIPGMVAGDSLFNEYNFARYIESSARNAEAMT